MDLGTFSGSYPLLIFVQLSTDTKLTIQRQQSGLRWITPTSPGNFSADTQSCATVAYAKQNSAQDWQVSAVHSWHAIFTWLSKFRTYTLRSISYNPLSPPGLSRFTSARLFYVPQVENEVKRTPLCGCCWDRRSRNRWIKAGPKRGIFGRFSETVRTRKSLYICQ